MQPASPATADSTPAAARRWPTHLLVVALYLAATLALTYPLLLRLTTELGGWSVDMWMFPWGAWWTARSLRGWTDPFHTGLLYFPGGTDLVFHTLFLPANVWAALVTPAISLVTFHNLTLVVGLFTSALAAYALALHLTGSPPAAFLAGLIYGFTPNRLDQARAHPEAVMGVWLALAVLGGVMVLRAHTPGRRVLAALASAAAVALGLLTREAYAFAALYLLALLALLRPLPDMVVGRLRGLFWCAAIGVVTLILLGPYALRVWQAWPPPEPPSHYPAEHVLASVSIERFVVPPAASTLWGGISRALEPGQPIRRAGKVAFLGFTVIALVAWSVVSGWRDRAWRFWMGCGLFFLLLSLGPVLLVGERATDIGLPYRYLPLMSLLRAPDRMVPAAVLCLSLAVATVWPRSGAAWRTGVVALALAADLALVPFPSVRPSPSPFYAQLAASPDAFALFEVPGAPDRNDKLYMFYQTIHGKPLQGGHVSRLPAATERQARATPLRRFALDAGRGKPASPPADLATELRRLRDEGFRYLIVHWRFAEGDQFRGANADETGLATAVAAIVGPPAYEDQWLSAYDLRRSVATDSPAPAGAP